MRRLRGYAWIWKVVRSLLQIAGVLIVLLLGIGGWMAWDSVPLKRDLGQVAQSFQVGGSPFLIPLPADRNSVVLVGGGRAPGVVGSPSGTTWCVLLGSAIKRSRFRFSRAWIYGRMPELWRPVIP